MKKEKKIAKKMTVSLKIKIQVKLDLNSQHINQKKGEKLFSYFSREHLPAQHAKAVDVSRFLVAGSLG